MSPCLSPRRRQPLLPVREGFLCWPRLRAAALHCCQFLVVVGPAGRDDRQPQACRSRCSCRQATGSRSASTASWYWRRNSARSRSGKSRKITAGSFGSSTLANLADMRPSYSRARDFRWRTGTTGSSRREIPEAGSSRTDRGGAGRGRLAVRSASRCDQPRGRPRGAATARPGLAVNLTLIDGSEPHAVVVLRKCLQDRLEGGTVRGRVAGVVGDEDPGTAAPGVPCPGQVAGVL